MKKSAALIILLLTIMFVLGCSSGGGMDVTSPKEPVGKSTAESSHYTWGLWQFEADLQAQTLEVIPLRAGNFHLNALPFLEPPPLLNLTLESLEFNGDIIEADIGLRHPFLGLTEFTGFDVCGILYTNGSITGFTDPGLRMAGDGDTRLLNPDGYSRWWNPTEFPVNNGTIFGYTDGLLGAPDSFADYNCTLNGYKYFCDDLDDVDDPLSDVTIENRGMFSAGQKNIRHYSIRMGTDGLIFNYAIDACWQFPGDESPWTAPDDFSEGANRVEAWNINATEVENTLWNDGDSNGGGLILTIDVYDWYNADMNTVRVESPGNFDMVETASAIDGGEGYSTYQVEITDATPGEGEIDLLITIISEEEDFEGFIPGMNTSAYFTHSVTVSGETPSSYHWEFDAIDTFTGLWGSDQNTREFDQLSPAIIEENDGDLAIHWSGNDNGSHIIGLDSAVWARISYDNGVNYISESTCAGGSDGMFRSDTCKIAAGPSNNAYCTDRYHNPTYHGDIFRVEGGSSARACFTSQTQEELEVIVDASGYIYGFDAGGNNIQAKHSQGPDILDPIHWGNPPYVAFTVATDSTISHVRSVGMDSSDVLWIAYYTNDETQIKLAHSTDSSPHEAWDSSTVVYTAGSGIDSVINPSLWIDQSDVFHILYTRYDSSSGNYQLVYAKDDSAFDDPTVQIIFESSTKINDAHVCVGEKFGEQVIIFIYENNKSVFLYTLVGGISLGLAVEIDGGTDDIDPDAILDADQCDLHALWATLDGTNYDIARRNGVLVED